MHIERNIQIIYLSVLITLLLDLNSAQAKKATPQSKPIYNKNNLVLWQGDTNDYGVYQYKVRLSVNTDIAAFCALFRDLSKLPDEMESCVESQLIEQI